MKKLIIALTATFITLTSQAQVLEAKPIEKLLQTIESSEFTYLETGKIFGFISTQSCLFVAKDIAIFRNYCFPVKDYPAKGYTIISKDFGMIDLYQEELPGALKRDIQITQFQDILLPYLTTPLEENSLAGLSAMIEKLHYQYNPGCWSTNFSFYTETNDAACSVSSEYVPGFEQWAAETQSIVMDEKNWNEMLNLLKEKLVK